MPVTSPRLPHRHVLLQRHPGNPILTAADWPYAVNAAFNPGATRLETGDTLLLVRVEDMRGISHLSAARSADGVTDWRIAPEPALMPDPVNWPQEVWGIEDPRITFLPEYGEYAVTYTAYGSGGPGVALAFTVDFRSFRRVGMLLSPEDKDAALFPRRFNGRWAMIHRPSAASRPAHMWLSFSPDLKHWGDMQVLMPARAGAWWDANKIGLAGPPVETERGWLIFYHGVKDTAAGSIYRLGLALLDLEDPRKVLLRGDEWVFGPLEPYERTGDVADVVFPCGGVMDDDGDTLRLYYGAADTAVCLATCSVRELLDWLQDHGRPPVGLMAMGAVQPPPV